MNKPEYLQSISTNTIHKTGWIWENGQQVFIPKCASSHTAKLDYRHVEVAEPDKCCKKCFR